MTFPTPIRRSCLFQQKVPAIMSAANPNTSGSATYSTSSSARVGVWPGFFFLGALGFQRRLTVGPECHCAGWPLEGRATRRSVMLAWSTEGRERRSPSGCHW
jgi:hypothetical protein